MEGTFDKNAEDCTMEYFSFSAKVFRWCWIFLIPVAIIYAFMMGLAYRQGINSSGGFLFLFCVLFYAKYLKKSERAYQQYAREAREAIEKNSTDSYSPKALELRNAQQKERKGVYYLIAGMVIFLGLLCMVGGMTIMMMGGSLIFWGSPILVLSLPCFLLGSFYIRMGKSVPR